MREVLDTHTAYGDVGRVLPDVWLVAGARTVELAGLVDAESALALLADDLAGAAPGETIAILAIPRRA
jgi:hypothetical protein